MTSYEPPPPRTYRLPSMSSRLGWGLVRAIPLAVFYLGWPSIGQTLTMRFGVPFPFPLGTVLLFGVGLLVLSIASNVAKPTRAYGPASLAYGVMLLAYLLWLAGRSTARVTFQGAMISIDFSQLMLLAAVVPVLLIGSALVTTVEDGLRPAERYPFDFPA